MKTSSLCVAAAVLNAACLLGASAYAAGVPPPDTGRAVIITFKPLLPSSAPEMTDIRVRDLKAFGYLHKDVLGHIQRLEKEHGFRVRHGFSNVFKGFSAHLTEAQITKLKANPLIAVVEPDVAIRTFTQVLPYGIYNSGATVSSAARAGDGLANQTPGLANVRVVVIDSGIAPHPDLNVIDAVNYANDGANGDCNGHGTHVAGTIGAKDNGDFVVGMAPGVPLIAAKVVACDGTGSTSALVKAFDYTAGLAKANPNLRYVANLSLGLPTGTTLVSLDSAVRGAVQSGVFVAVAAGNGADNTCGTALVDLSSGTAGTGVMAVAAADTAGKEAYFSAYGPCVAAWAPGVTVVSTSAAGALATMSGTSMATPHVTGAAALVRALAPQWSAGQVDEQLKALARPTGALSKDGRTVRHVDVSRVGSAASGAVQIVPVPVPAPPTQSRASAAASVVDFGVVQVGSSPVKVLSFTNTGTAPMSLTGLVNLPLAVSASTTCVNTAPGAACVITFRLNTQRPVAPFSVTLTTVGATTNTTFVLKGAVVQ